MLPKEYKKLLNIKMLVLDFDGVLTNNKVTVSDQGREYVLCDRSDGIGIKNLKDKNILIYIVSSEKNPVVKHRADKLGIPCIQSVADKSIVLNDLAAKYGFSLEEIAFIGNDINDIPALEIVGVPIGVQDCHVDIEKHILFKTTSTGGNGAVREICDIICKDI
jgi:YrbI family 3-deoxy-D-manno-octulosonate 8-phosphate phosphatase